MFKNKIGWFGEKSKRENINHKMLLKSRDLGNGRYEVAGVIVYAKSHAEAVADYRRRNKL